MNHTPECKQLFEDHAKAVEKFQSDHPNYCKTCGGWGGIPSLRPSSYHEHETLIGTDSCPDCFEKGICPLCGIQSLETQLSELGEVTVCTSCGWNEIDSEGLPEKPDCDCWIEESPAKLEVF